MQGDIWWQTLECQNVNSMDETKILLSKYDLGRMDFEWLFVTGNLV